MNTLIKYLITTGIIIAVLSVLSLVSLTNFGQSINTIAVWLFNSFVPFKNILNFPAIIIFILEVMSFELAYWSWELADRVFGAVTGGYLRRTGYIYADKDNPHMDITRSGERSNRGVKTSVRTRQY